MVYVMRALLAHLLVASLNRKLGFITKHVQCLGTRLAITYYASLPVWHARLSLIHPWRHSHVGEGIIRWGSYRPKLVPIYVPISCIHALPLFNSDIFNLHSAHISLHT